MLDCLGTVLSHLKVFATILQFLLPGLLLLLGRVPPSRLLTRLYTGVCYDPAVPTSLAYFSFLDARLLPDYSHGYTQVFATILQFLHLWPTSPSWTRASFQTTHTAIHRCLLRSCSSYISGLLLLLGRAPPSRLLTRLYTGVCYDPAVPTSWPTSPPWTRAPSRLLTRLYTGVCYDPAVPTSWPTSPPWTRAPSRLLTRLYTGVCYDPAVPTSWPTSPPWTRAPSRLLTRLYTGVCYDPAVPTSWPTSPPWTRAPSRLLTRLYTGVCYDPAVPTSWPTSPPWTRAPPDYSHGYTQGGCLTVWEPFKTEDSPSNLLQVSTKPWSLQKVWTRSLTSRQGC